jgi:GT2 family glycosyltransferase
LTKETQDSTTAAELVAAQAKLSEYQQEILDLQQALEARTQDINKLIQWTQSLQQDILAVYNSITWQTGNFITQMALKLLRRPGGPTARDHINKIFTTFESWKINYCQSQRQSGLQSYMPWHDTKEYALWIKRYDTLNPIMLDQMCNQLQQWSYQPLISLLMSTNHANEQWLLEAIQSVQAQLYPHWELCLAHQNTLAESIIQTIALEPRIQLLDCPPAATLAATLNQALAQAKGDFIAVMGEHDQLPSHALYKVVEWLNRYPQTDLLYSDEDKLDEKGQRYDPYFKSDWNPDLFYSQNFLQHLTLYRRAVIAKIQGFQPNYPGNENYDFTLRFIEQIASQNIHHIPHILYHQRQITQPVPIPYNTDSHCQALQAHLQRLNQAAQVVAAPGGHTRVIYQLPSPLPLVSLIIPTRDKLNLLRGTVDGCLNQTDYDNIEIIIMDNSSVESETLAYLKAIQHDNRVNVIRYAAPFNYSQLNNIGVAHAQGDIIGLINNDLEVISPAWLTEMVSHALRPEIGAVGAKLYYANDTIQHAGVIVGLGGMAGHGLKFLAREAPGYHWKPFLIQNYSVVTGACLVLRRQVFVEVGGLEEKHLQVAFNDVDLCLRIQERGYRIVWTPYAELYHLESASRGLDNTLKKFLRLRHELNYMKSRWASILMNDPYYNPNLTIEYEDFSLAYPPRVNLF